MNLKKYLNEKQLLVEKALKEYCHKPEGCFEKHIEAMRYSLFVGGKRVRPILCLAAGAAVSGQATVEKRLLPVACALECIHTYSLIHDDLPAMDDDELRRGEPTNHTLFGEAGAILAGDSLLTFSFELLSNSLGDDFPADKQLEIINTVAKSAGPLGMVGGQALDMASENSEFPFTTLQTIHKHKTGALITASVKAGAIGGGANAEEIDRLAEFGDKIGLAFQIVDDLLNATSTTEKLGKAAGSDESRGKATYPAYFGLEKTRLKAKETIQEALDSLQGFDHKADPLRALAEYIYSRSH